MIFPALDTFRSPVWRTSYFHCQQPFFQTTSTFPPQVLPRRVAGHKGNGQTYHWPTSDLANLPVDQLTGLSLQQDLIKLVITAMWPHPRLQMAGPPFCPQRPTQGLQVISVCFTTAFLSHIGIGSSVSPKIHMLKSYFLTPWNVVIFEDKAFKRCN